jgi:hypothetical protein
LFSVILSSCQSSRLAVFRPDVSAYHSPASLRPAPVAVAEPPLLEANSHGSHERAQAPLRMLAHEQKEPATPAAQPVAAIGTAPDTLYGRPVGKGWPQAASSPVDSSVPDPATFTVNMVGGALVAAGLITLAANSGSDSDTGTDWDGLFLGLVALAAIPVGVALLFYQGVNGRQRLKRAARQQARKDAAPAVATNPTTVASGTSNRPLLKIGIGVLIGGALLLAVGALLAPYGLLFFGLPGFILLISGLIISISAL